MKRREFLKLSMAASCGISFADRVSSETLEEDNQSWQFKMAPGQQFAADSYVHQPLADHLPSHPNSKIWQSSIIRQIEKYYGQARVNIDVYTPPIYMVGKDQPTVKIKAERTYQPSWSYAPFQNLISDVPLPNHFKPSDGTDQEVIIYQPSTGRYWELWRCQPTGALIKNSEGITVEEWRAAWGARIDNISDHPGYFAPSKNGDLFGVAASGIPLLAGLITIKEQFDNEINHPIHFSLVDVKKGAWLYPAQRSDGNNPDMDSIPEGATFRFPVDLDISSLKLQPYCGMICRAVQKYGMIVRDRAGAVAFYAQNPIRPRDHENPYFGHDGILQCPNGNFEWSCAASTKSRLKGFPWDKLVAIQRV